MSRIRPAGSRFSGLLVIPLGAVAAVLAACTSPAPAPSTPVAESTFGTSIGECAPGDATARPTAYIGAAGEYQLVAVSSTDPAAPEPEQPADPTTLMFTADSFADESARDDFASEEVADEWAHALLDSLIEQNYLPEDSGTAQSNSTATPTDPQAQTLLGAAGVGVRAEIEVLCGEQVYFTGVLESTLPVNAYLLGGCPAALPEIGDGSDPRLDPAREQLAAYCE
jgi:hypothetical protein